MQRRWIAFPFFLLFLCWPAFGQERGGQRTANLEDNVRHALRLMGLENAVLITGSTSGEVFAIASPGDPVDRLAKALQDKKQWRQCWNFFTRVQHHGDDGWRAKGNWSLHVILHHTFDPDGTLHYSYAMHIDRWSPGGIFHPVSSAAHLALEYVPHSVTHGATSQTSIEKGLDKKDPAH